MRIFVQRASECLTDHLPHGDGLICFSLLAGLTHRGHEVFAYTNHDGVDALPKGLTIRAQVHRSPANSLSDLEHAWRASRWFREVDRHARFDLVWRMHPYGVNCPVVPRIDGRPLVVGPLFYNWPASAGSSTLGKPRLGIGLKPLLDPLFQRGWQRTLQKASLVVCATERQSEQIRNVTSARVETLPVIVDPPTELPPRAFSSNQIRLVFVANLVVNKRPGLFCEIVAQMRALGNDVRGFIIGEGPLRSDLESRCQQLGIANQITFAGRLPNKEVFARLAESDLLVSCSLGEPYGRGIVEAMSVGTPAICHRSGGPADFITDGKDGVLIDSFHSDAYAARIRRMIQDNALPAMSQKALESAADWKSEPVLDQLEALLRETVARSK